MVKFSSDAVDGQEVAINKEVEVDTLYAIYNNCGGDVTNNTINVSAGNITNLYTAYTGGNISGNIVNVSGGNITNLYAGQSISNSKVTSNNINVSGTAEIGTVYLLNGTNKLIVDGESGAKVGRIDTGITESDDGPSGPSSAEVGFNGGVVTDPIDVSGADTSNVTLDNALIKADVKAEEISLTNGSQITANATATGSVSISGEKTTIAEGASVTAQGTVTITGGTAEKGSTINAGSIAIDAGEAPVKIAGNVNTAGDAAISGSNAEISGTVSAPAGTISMGSGAKLLDGIINGNAISLDSAEIKGTVNATGLMNISGATTVSADSTFNAASLIIKGGDIAGTINAETALAITEGSITGNVNVKADSGALAMGGGSIRSNSGSYVDSRGWGIDAGMAKTIKNRHGELLFGPMIDYSKGSYSSHLDNGTRGDGKSRSWAIGGFAKQSFASCTYLEGSLRAGRINSDYRSAELGSYNTAATCYSAHIGAGQIKQVSKKRQPELLWQIFFYPAEQRRCDDT